MRSRLSRLWLQVPEGRGELRYALNGLYTGAEGCELAGGPND